MHTDNSHDLTVRITEKSYPSQISDLIYANHHCVTSQKFFLQFSSSHVIKEMANYLARCEWRDLYLLVIENTD